MLNTLDHEVVFLCGRTGQFLVIDTKTGEQLKPGDKVTSFRGEDRTLLSVTRGREYNGTAKVLTEEPDGWKQEYYSTVYDLKVLPLIETGRKYRLDVYNRQTMVRAWHLVEVAAWDDNLVITGYELDDEFSKNGREVNISWDDVFIAEPLS